MNDEDAMNFFKQTKSAVEIGDDCTMIMDGATVFGGISAMGVHVACPKCGSSNVLAHRLTIRGSVPQPGADIECLACGHREVAD